MEHKKKLGIPGGLCGVYSIRTPTGRLYIGSSSDIRRRWYEHRWRMKNGKSSSPALDRAFRKYGYLLSWEVIELCSKSDLIRREQFYFEEMKPELNSTLSADFAIKWLAQNNPAVSKKIAESSAIRDARRRKSIQSDDGRIWAGVQVAARDLGLSGGFVSRLASTQMRSKAGLRLKLFSDEWRAEITFEDRIAAAYQRMAETNRGKKQSAETRQRRRDTMLAKNLKWTPERHRRHKEAMDAKGKAKATA
jgi:group I intron endonuclease